MKKFHITLTNEEMSVVIQNIAWTEQSLKAMGDNFPRSTGKYLSLVGSIKNKCISSSKGDITFIDEFANMMEKLTVEDYKEKEKEERGISKDQLDIYNALDNN